MRRASCASLSITAITILLLSACAGSQRTAETNVQSEQKSGASSAPITIAQYGHLLIYLPLYVALDNGYFKEHGLDAKIISTGGDEKTYAAIASNNAQFGVSDPTFVAIARQRGQGGKVVASVVNGVPFWGVAFDEKVRPVSSRKDFAGLRIATYPAPSTNYTVMKKVLENNGHPVKATIVQGSPNGSLLAMLKAKQADVAMELEPTASIGVREGGHIVCSLQKEFGDFAITGLMVTEEFARKEPQQVSAAVQSLAQAMTFIKNDFEGAMKVAQKEFPEIDEKTLRSALKRMADEGTMPSSPRITEEAWNKAIAMRHEVGDLANLKDGAFSANVDMTFVNAINDKHSP